MNKIKNVNTENDAYLVLSWISDVCDLSTVNSLNKYGAISTNSRSEYITSYTDNLSKINKVNFTDNVAVSKVMSYLRAIEDELLTW